MARKAATAGFDGAKFDEEGNRVIAVSEAPVLMDFAARSERSYRGKAGWSGHDGSRVENDEHAKALGQRKGTFCKQLDEQGVPIFRQRWTTALQTEALDHLHALAAELGVNRCVVVEQLLLDPQCRQILQAKLKRG